MTDTPRAIEGDYADFKLIRTRKVCQIVVEVPLEKAESVTRLLGFPNVTTGTRCAVVLLNQDSGPSPTRGPEQAEGDRVPVAAPSAPKPNSTRAVMMAKDPEFQRFCGCTTESAADFHIKAYCDVKSKTELNADPGAMRFEALRRDFNAWKRAHP